MDRQAKKDKVRGEGRKIETERKRSRAHAKRAVRESREVGAISEQVNEAAKQTAKMQRS